MSNYKTRDYVKFISCGSNMGMSKHTVLLTCLSSSILPLENKMDTDCPSLQELVPNLHIPMSL